MDTKKFKSKSIDAELVKKAQKAGKSVNQFFTELVAESENNKTLTHQLEIERLDKLQGLLASQVELRTKDKVFMTDLTRQVYLHDKQLSDLTSAVQTLTNLLTKALGR